MYVEFLFYNIIFLMRFFMKFMVSIWLVDFVRFLVKWLIFVFSLMIFLFLYGGNSERICEGNEY